MSHYHPFTWTKLSVAHCVTSYPKILKLNSTTVLFYLTVFCGLVGQSGRAGLGSSSMFHVLSTGFTCQFSAAHRLTRKVPGACTGVFSNLAGTAGSLGLSQAPPFHVFWGHFHGVLPQSMQTFWVVAQAQENMVEATSSLKG